MTSKVLLWSVTAAALVTPASDSVTRGESSRSYGATLLVSGLQGASGSTVGPDGALYVTEGAVGKITRVNPRNGQSSTFASGLPPSVIGIGGVIDVAFLDRRAYALVTLVGADVGGSDIVGLYRISNQGSATPIADIGKFSTEHPPKTPFDLPTGVQYALDIYRGEFLVTDGHHNRVLRVTPRGKVSEMLGFGNIVPTGLAVSGPFVFMGQAGPVPHLAPDGKVMLLVPPLSLAIEVGAGAPLLVDVEFDRNRTLFALSQGIFPEGQPPGAPALPDTGALFRVNWDGTLTTVLGGLNRPTSLEFIGDTAYVVTLGGEIWKIDD